MKSNLSVVAIALMMMINSANAQTDPAIVKSSTPIEMLFPQRNSKALILSFDDGNVADRHLVKLMNENGLVGTFHLNSNKLGKKDYLTKEEIKNVYKGHEVSGHTANHPNLTALSKVDVIYEVLEDRKELERLVDYPIRGMSYPFGNTNDFVVEAISGLGIEYARTVGDIGLVDYINAYKNLKFSVDKSMVTNLSSMDVFVKMNGKVFTVEAVSTKQLN